MAVWSNKIGTKGEILSVHGTGHTLINLFFSQSSHEYTDELCWCQLQRLNVLLLAFAKNC